MIFIPVIILVLLLIFLTSAVFVQIGKGRKKSLAATKSKKTIKAVNPEKRLVAKPKIIRIEPVRRELLLIRPTRSEIVRPQAIRIQPAAVVKVQPAKAVTVKPPARGAWDERGWTRTTNGKGATFDGFYLVGSRKFHGRIEAQNGERKIAAYIQNPPREVKQHRHGPCFQLVRDGWFHLHWARPAQTVDDAILYVEKVLDESLKG